MLALLDGDEAVFAACALEEIQNTEAGGSDVFGGMKFDMRDATHEDRCKLLDEIFESWRTACSADSYKVILSPDGRQLFRRGVAADYKAGRKDKPEAYWPLVEYCRQTHPCVDIEGLEGDDVMGLMSGPGVTICSQDKDMKTIPGLLYNTRHQTLTYVTQEEADRWWMYQTLIGDSTDGYKGCLGCGPKRAEAVLAMGACLEDWWPLVVAEYEATKKGKYKGVRQGIAEALQQAVLARILRPGDHREGRVRYSLCGAEIHLDALTGSPVVLAPV